MMTAKIVGWALLGVGIFLLLRTAQLDRRLQQFRAPGMPAAAYLGKLGRWRRDLYTPRGQPLIGPTRPTFGLFCVASLLGALVLEFERDSRYLTNGTIRANQGERTGNRRSSQRGA